MLTGTATMEIGAFLSLLGAMWVTFVPVTAHIKHLNEIRDRVLGMGGAYSSEHRSLMLRNDWLPFLLMASTEQIVLIILLFLFPSFDWFNHRMDAFSYVFGNFAAVRFLGFAYTFRKDYVAMKRHLGQERSVESRDGLKDPATE